MFGDMMGKLGEMKQKTEEAKARLKTISVTGEAGGITVIATGDRQIKDITISAELANADRDELQDLLVLAVNKALTNAKNVEEAEMASSMKGMLPGMGL